MRVSPERAKAEVDALLARVSKVMSVSISELRLGLDAEWTGRYEETDNVFVWEREGGFRCAIEVSPDLLDWSRMERNPEDASTQVAFPWVMTATRAYAAAAWVLRTRNDSVPSEVIP